MAAGALGEAAQGGALAAQRDEVGAGEAQPVEPRADGPQLTAEPPRVQPGDLDARGDHAGGHRIVVQDGAHPCAVPVVEEPRSGDTKHPPTMPDARPGAHDGIRRRVRQPTVTWGLALALDRLGDLHRLLDQGLDDRVLRHGLDDLALDEDLALAVAGGHPEVGLAGLPRAVHHAAHDGDAQRHLHAGEPGGDLVGELVDVDLGAPARRAGDDLQLARPQVERLQDLRADLDLLDRRRGERDADRVADALPQQRPERHRRLDRALERRAGLGDAEVQRVVAGLGEQLVGADHDDRVVVLDRDLDVVEVVLGEQARLPQRRLDERLRRGLAVLLHEPLVERAGVDADPDRGAVVLRGGRDLLDLVVELADVARVHPHRRAAGLDRGEDVLGLEVDVGDHRDLRLPRDRRAARRRRPGWGRRRARCRSRPR